MLWSRLSIEILDHTHLPSHIRQMSPLPHPVLLVGCLHQTPISLLWLFPLVVWSVPKLVWEHSLRVDSEPLQLRWSIQMGPLDALLVGNTPPSSKPSWRHATSASFSPKLSLVTVPHLLLRNTANLPNTIFLVNEVFRFVHSTFLTFAYAVVPYAR